MNRCSSEDFYFDPKNNIYAVQVSDAFDTSQAMDLCDTFNTINKSNAVCTRKFNIRLGDLIVNKPDWLTRYKELCNIPVPCLVLTTGGVTEETMTNLVNMFLNSRTPGIYLCNRSVFGHIHRKAEAMELRSTVVPIEMNNQVYYRFTDKSIYMDLLMVQHYF